MNNTGGWCGKCKYHECTEPKNDIDAEWVCSNPNSDYYADITHYTDYCDNFTEKEK